MCIPDKDLKALEPMNPWRPMPSYERQTALAEAIKLENERGGDADQTVATAEKFLAFLNGGKS